MKKFFAILVTALLCVTCMAFAACEKIIPIESISIVQPATTEIRVGESFALECTTVPEEAAKEIKVNWQIDDTSKLSYKNGKFTALTCGPVKVKATVKGNTATDEIELRVLAPEGFKEFGNTGYRLVRPSNWSQSKVGVLYTWTASNGTSSMNVSTEELNKTYFVASAGSYQSMIETSYGLMGYTVKFDKAVTVQKSTYLGVKRVQVNYLYTLTKGSSSTKLHQTQLIFNNSAENLSCILTVSFLQEDFDEDAAKLQQTIFNQFMPA